MEEEGGRRGRGHHILHLLSLILGTPGAADASTLHATHPDGGVSFPGHSLYSAECWSSVHAIITINMHRGGAESISPRRKERARAKTKPGVKGAPFLTARVGRKVAMDLTVLLKVTDHADNSRLRHYRLPGALTPGSGREVRLERRCVPCLVCMKVHRETAEGHRCKCNHCRRWILLND